MVDMSDKIIKASVALIVFSAIGVVGLVDLFTAVLTSVPGSVVTIVTTLVGILFGVGIALAFYRYFQGKSE